MAEKIKPKKEDNVTWQVRLPGDLRDAFLAAAEQNDRNGAQLVRDFMREYVKKNYKQQRDLF